MKKDDDIEEQVLKRYIELAGLVRDGRMVNRDKENRSKEYVKLYTRTLEEITNRDLALENSKYGEFIIQANEVGYYLAKLIFIRSFNHSDKFEKDLEALTLGPLISYLNVCATTKLDLNLIEQLRGYKNKRDALAHKMFTDRKLTSQEREAAIKSGSKIIKYLSESLKDKKQYMIKGTDKISEFPSKFNELTKTVESLKQRVDRLEKEKTKEKK